MDQNCCRSPSTFLVCRWCTKDVGGAAAGDGCLAADADALGVEEPLGGRPRRPDEEPFFPPPPPFFALLKIIISFVLLFYLEIVLLFLGVLFSM